MKKFYKVVRAIIMTLVALCVFVPVALYLVLSTDWAQEKIRTLAEQELTKVFGTEVTIGGVDITPFNRLEVSDVTIADDFGKTALTSKNLEARFEFWNFVTTGRLAFDYAVLQGVDIRLYKATPDSSLNIAGILEHLKSKEKKKEPTRFDLSLMTIRLENATFTYDVLDRPQRPGKFDPNHIALTKVTMMATAPRLSNDEIYAKVRQLAFVDRSGLAVTNIRVEARYTPTSLQIDNLELNLPGSHFDFGSYRFTYDNPDELKTLFNSVPIDVSIAEGSYFTVSDFGWAVPAIAKVNRRFGLSLDATASRAGIDLRGLNIDEVTDGGFFLDLSANISNPLSLDSLKVEGLNLNVDTYAPSVTGLLRKLDRPMPSKTAAMLNRLGRVRVVAQADASLSGAQGDVSVVSELGAVHVNGTAKTGDKFRNIDADINLAVDDFDLGALIGNSHIGNVTTTATVAGRIRPHRLPVLDAAITDTYIQFNGNEAHDIRADIDIDDDGTFGLNMEAYIDNAALFADIHGMADSSRPGVGGKLTVTHFNPNRIGLTGKYPGYELDVDVDFELAGRLQEWIDGYVNISNLNFRGDTGPGLFIEKFFVSANNTVRPNEIQITSDFLNGTFIGNLRFSALPAQIRKILSPVMPLLIKSPESAATDDTADDNNFRFELELDHAESLVNFLKLPVAIIHPIDIEGSMSFENQSLTVGIDAPYLMKGDMIIENTSVQAKIDATTGTGNVYLTTQFPTKKGDMVLVGGITGSNNVFTTRLDWSIQRDKPIEGELAFTTELMRDVDTGDLGLRAVFHPSDIRFGNDIWKFAPSTVVYRKNYLAIDNFGLASATQSININGVCDVDNPDSEIIVKLDKIVLNTIFETLDINKALLAGTATGTFHASDIFGGSPRLECNNLHVDGIGYNRCVLGDGDVVARWDNDTKSFFLDADITEGEGRHSYIKGNIYPATEALDITFRADRVKVGFMKPFIDAFASDITGYASGWARIFGTFKYIDMEGDILAEDLGIKIDFTNTWYYATDSIHLRPGLIDVPAVEVRDPEGHTARLTGLVKHTFFKDPIFDFRVTDARNFLSYDVTPALSPDWYGRIYGNGSAFITGKPGVVNIDVNMSTADGSTFTFVLSDLEEAEQYSFITFRDKNRDVITDSIIQVDILPAAVREYRDRVRAQALAQNPPSAYNMNIQVDITPAAKIILVMDPVGGDEIKSWGKGSLRMTYASKGNDLHMYGTYTIDRGSYNFTLQDIIVKDFSIKDGSSITFTGDPYNAALDIMAYYTVNANLTDLDESFMYDSELNRTNVPVRALLLVRGDMRQPDIDFDLEFPTQTSDVYRKVRSIVSTDEMMNRQIIYLLALNRFYTPEYMSATKGSELFSVASSTISSRLSSMLGKLSENWTIAPNLRSDRGDFSDVQFDLALSSTLLNNRLRFNGNFGYRDKSLNTTQFVGDFDLEYLLNRSGSWRLKAYNRFNDQTYFLRTAKTTQGVGVKFQRDFDNMFSFLRRRKKSSSDTVPTPVRTPALEPDTITTTPEKH